MSENYLWLTHLTNMKLNHHDLICYATLIGCRNVEIQSKKTHHGEPKTMFEKSDDFIFPTEFALTKIKSLKLELQCYKPFMQ